MGVVTITESRTSLSVYQLSGPQAKEVVALLEAGDWTNLRISDEGGALHEEMLKETSKDITVVADRKALPTGVEGVITLSGFDRLLSRAPSSRVVWVEGLEQAVDTLTVRYAPWGDIEEFEVKGEVADPAKVVRFLAPSNEGRGNLARFILKNPDQPANEPSLAPWRKRAIDCLTTALAHEVEPDGQLLFRGPPPTRYALSKTAHVRDSAFAALQRATAWTYENDRELENRHGLLAAEVARTSLRGGDISDLLNSLELALEGARIAYAFGVNQQSKEALRSLADLRKAISDDTAKLSETTRSLCAAVVGAVFGNIGLLIARVSLQSNAKFIGGAAILLGVVLALYVAAIIYSGHRYIGIQRQLRKDWREKVYRFLTDEDYEKLVGDPVKKSENTFYVVSLIGMLMVLLCLYAVYDLATP